MAVPSAKMLNSKVDTKTFIRDIILIVLVVMTKLAYLSLIYDNFIL